MPHIIVEYSANLAEVAAIPELLSAVHQTAAASGLFEVGAIRTRAAARELVMIGDGNPTNGFIVITVRMKAGRALAVQEKFAAALMDTASRYLATAFDERFVTLNVEIHEIPGINLRRRSGD